MNVTIAIIIVHEILFQMSEKVHNVIIKTGKPMKLKRALILTLIVLTAVLVLSISPLFITSANAQVYYYTPTVKPMAMCTMSSNLKIHAIRSPF